MYVVILFVWTGPLTVLLSDRVVRLLGRGAYANVVEAVDTHTQAKVAIKIVLAIPKYRERSKAEVRALQNLRGRDPLNR